MENGGLTMKQIIAVLVVSSFVIGCSTKMEPKTQSVSEVMAEMTPEQMMQKMEMASKPGPQHSQLKPLVGKWRTTSKFWKAPGEKPEITRGSANHQWLYGKRFVKEDYKGTWHGQPFHGTGMIGYDNVKQQYISTWTDSMSTGIMTAEGEFDPSTNELEMNSSFSCPLTESERNARSITRIINNNEHVLEMYDLDADGKEYKMMEIHYKRIG